MTRTTEQFLVDENKELEARIAELEAALNEILEMRTVGGPSAYYYARDVRAIVGKALRKSNN